MPFQDEILAGEVLIRSAIRSENWVDSAAGWRIAADGAAQLNNLTARGSIYTGPPGTARVHLTGPQVNFESGDPDETSAANIIAYSGPGTNNDPWLEISTAEVAWGYISLLFKAAISDADPGGWAFDDLTSSFNSVNSSAVTLLNKVRMRIDSAEAKTLAGAMHPLQIGTTAAANLVADKAGVQARSNGAAAALGLNPLGGAVNTGAGTLTAGGALTATGTLTATAAATVGGALTANGAATVAGTLTANGAAALNGTVTAAAARAASVADATARTTASLTYVDAATTAATTFTYPASGVLLVTVSGRVNNTAATAGHAACLGFEIRDTNAAGVVRYAANDSGAAIARDTAVPTPGSRTVVVTGLPTSGTGYIRSMLRTNNAANAANAIQVTVAIQPSL